MEMMEGLQLFPKLSVRGFYCVPLSFPRSFISLAKLENFKNNLGIHLLGKKTFSHHCSSSVNK